MARLIVLLVVSLNITALALDVDDIRKALRQAKSSDTLEIKSRITVTIKGNSQVIETQIVQFGKDKIWTELKSEALNQRTIRNGSRVMITDLKTNKSRVVDISDNKLAIPQAAQQVIDPLGNYSWSIQEKQLDGQYMLHSIERDLWFDAIQGRVTQIVDRDFSDSQVVSISHIKYCDQCSIKNQPELIETQVKVNGVMESEMRVEFVVWKISSNLPSRLFDF